MKKGHYNGIVETGQQIQEEPTVDTDITLWAARPWFGGLIPAAIEPFVRFSETSSPVIDVRPFHSFVQCVLMEFFTGLVFGREVTLHPIQRRDVA